MESVIRITIKPLWHNQTQYIAIEFDLDETVQHYVTAFPDTKWSKTYQTFYTTYYKERINQLFTYFRKKGWYVNYAAFKVSAKQVNVPVAQKPVIINKLPTLIDEQKTQVIKYKKWLEQKRFSPNTVNTYVEVTALFLRYVKLKKIPSISARSIEQFNYDFIFVAKKSVSYQNQCISGIKHFLDFKGIEIETIEIKRPDKDKKLPNVLSKAEVKAIFDATQNLKHKTLLSLIYSAGLRIGEALNLQPKDIDFERGLIHIKSAKGRKDRYTLLSSALIPMLKRTELKNKSF